MCETLTLVRHGQSEENVALDLYKAGHSHENEPALMKVHTSERRLTALGRRQSIRAGQWLLPNWYDVHPKEDTGLVVSPYARTIETAGYFGFGDCWIPENRAVERNWGNLDTLPFEERVKKFGFVVETDESQAFFWQPLGGEPLQSVFVRIDSLMNMFRRNYSGKHMLLVTHGEAMWTWRALLEHWMPQRLAFEIQNRTEQTQIFNCRIIQYKRENGSEHFSHVRFIDPGEPDNPKRNLDWQPIIHPTFTSQGLLEYAEKFPRFLEE